MLEKEHTAAGYTHTHTSYTKAQTFFSLLITHFETSCIFFFPRKSVSVTMEMAVVFSPRGNRIVCLRRY